MQPRTLEAILSELNSTYDPQVASYRTQQSAIPGQIQAQEQGLQAKQNDAFGDITAGAQRRGVGFSGIPLGEQAKYTASTYLPALANLRTAGVQQATSLEDAINQINERKNTLAQQIYGQDQDRYFQAQQAAQARADAAAQNAGLSALFGGGATGGQTAAPAEAAKSNVTLQSFLTQKLQSQPNAPRALQDQWVRQWAQQTGKNEGDSSIWAAYNKILPWEQYNDSVRDPNKSSSVNYGSAIKQIPGQLGATSASRPGGLSLGNLGQNLKFFF